MRTFGTARRLAIFGVVAALGVGSFPTGGAQTPDPLPAAADRNEPQTVLVEPPSGPGLLPSDPRVAQALATSGQALGPSVVAGPGEVASVAGSRLAPGAPTAMELLGDGVAPAPQRPAVTAGETVIRLPGSVPESTKSKRLDRGSSRRSGRDAVSERFDNADGSASVLVGEDRSGVDSGGRVVDADPGLVDAGGGKLRRRVGTVRAEVAAEVAEGAELFAVGTTGARVAVQAKGVGPSRRAGKVTGSSVTYAGVYGPGTSVELEVGSTGVKESIVLSAAPPDGRRVEYRSTLVLDGLTPRANPTGSISLLDGSGKEQYAIPVGVAYEVPKKGEKPTVLGRVDIAVERVGERWEVVVRPDEAWLREPARRFPVVIDPTIQPGKDSTSNAFASVDSAYPSWHFNLCRTADTTCFGQISATHQSYAYLRYDTSAVSGKIINSAFLRLNQVDCFSAPAWPATLKARPLASSFDTATVTWDSRPQPRNEEATVVAGAAGSYSIDVTPWAVKWASGEWPSFGFRLDSTKDCQLKVKNTGSSFLEITYTDPGSGTNQRPSLPVQQTPANGALVSSPVTLSATSIDPEGDQIYYWFQGCRQPCGATEGFDSGWLTTNSWVFTGGTLGQSWEWWVFVKDDFNPYWYNTGPVFTLGTPAGMTPNENWEWGVSNGYSPVSTDVQPNSGVNTGTKRFVYSATDAQVASAGPALAVQRTYNSGETAVGAFGLGWSSVLDATVTADGSGNLTFRLPDGRREVHPLVGGVYRTQPGYWSTAAVDPNGGWTLLEKDGTLWRFRPSGRLSAVVDRNGRSLALIDDANTGRPTELRARGYAVQRSLTLSWTGNQVSSVSDGVNLAWNYAYTGTLLSKVCDPRNNNTATGLCTTYSYDAANRITAVTKPKGNKDVEVGYYADGTVQWRKDGMGNQWNFSYNTATRTSTTTDPLGRVTTEVFNPLFQLVSRTEPGDANVPAHTTTFSYDSNGFLSKVTSPITGSWEYVNDYRGNQVQVKDPTGATSYYVYDVRDLLIAYRDARSSSSTDNAYRWTYGYDANGNRVRETNPFGWSRTWSYNYGIGKPAGVLLSETDWRGNTTTYDYNAHGDVISIVYPGVAGDNVSYTYDALGRKLTETGRITAPGITYTYTPLNAPATITEPPVTNPITGLTRRRRVTLTYDNNNLRASMLEEDIGGSTSPEAPRTTTYAHDNNDREISTTNPLNGVSSRTFSQTGMVRTVTDPNGRVTRTDYNARDLPQTVIAIGFDDPTDALAPADRTLVSMAYDAAGRMTSQTNARGVQRTFTYDNMNRMLTRTLVGFTDRNGAARNIVEQRYTYDPLGNVLDDKRGNDSHVTWNLYDAAGRQIWHIDNSQPRWDWLTLDRNGNVEKVERVTTGYAVLTRKTVTYDARNRPLATTVDLMGAGPNRTTTTTYSKWGTPATVTDARGFVTTYGYDALGRTSTITTPAVAHEDTGGTAVTATAVTTFGYDTWGNQSAVRSPRGHDELASYDKLNRLLVLNQPVCTSGCQSPSVFEQYGYDNNGNVTSYRDRRGQTTNFAYDTLNRHVFTHLPAIGAAPRGQRFVKYDQVGNVTETTNEIGAREIWTYNQMDLPRTHGIVERFPTGTTATTTFDYNDLGQKTWQRDPLNHVTTYEYLQTGETYRSTDPTGAIWQWTWDAAGRMTSAIDPLNRSTKTIYNPAGEPVTQQRLNASAAVVTQTSATFDANGNRTSVTDGRGVTTTFGFDGLNRLSSVSVPHTPSALVTTYGYDRTNNLTRVTNARGVATTYTYNQWNLQTSTIEPATTAHPNVADRTFSVTYDAAGLPAVETQPGTTITRTFNERGFLTAETGAGAGLTTATRTFGRDTAGRLISINHESGTVGFTLNDKNQVLSSSGAGMGTATFTYDLKGRMTTRTDYTTGWYGQTYQFNWTARDELDTARDQLTALRDHTWNSAGELVTTVQGATTRTYTYDSIGRLWTDTLRNTATNATLHAVTYGYDNDDNLTAKNITAPGNPSAGNNTYTYDNPGRLATWTNPAGTVTTYAYDGAGNRTQAGASTFAYDNRNQILTGPSATYTWTARGTQASQTVAGTTTTYTSDALNRINSAVRGATTVNWFYDGLDRLSRRTENATQTHWFAYAGTETDPIHYSAPGSISTTTGRNPSGRATSFIQTAGAALAVGTDRHGDLTHYLNPTTATVDNTYLRDPFGVSLATTGTGQAANRYGFQTDWTDPLTGDVHMGARWYNPATSAFRTRDTVFGGTTAPITLNRYLYAGSNPLKYWDPTGRFLEGLGAAIEAMGGFDNMNLPEYPMPTYEPTVETFSTAPGVYTTISTDAMGNSTFTVTAPTGIAHSTPATTERSGNLTYTPDVASHVAAVVLASNGHAPEAIAQVANDLHTVSGALPTSQDLVEGVLEHSTGQLPSTNSDAPIAEPHSTGDSSIPWTYSVVGGIKDIAKNGVKVVKKTAEYTLPTPQDFLDCMGVLAGGSDTLIDCAGLTPGPGKAAKKIGKEIAEEIVEGATKRQLKNLVEVDGYLVGRHGSMPSPRNGHESHHAIQTSWMQAKYRDYAEKDAPAILMKTTDHHKTRAVYPKWASETAAAQGTRRIDWDKVSEAQIRDLMNRQLDEAGVPKSVRDEYNRQFDAYRKTLKPL